MCYKQLNYLIRTKRTPATDRRIFGVDVNDETLPDIWSMQFLIRWGEKIWDGEQKRVGLGGMQILTPHPQQIDLDVANYKARMLPSGLNAISCVMDRGSSFRRVQLAVSKRLVR